MNPMLLILGGGAVLWYLSQEKTVPPATQPKAPGTPARTQPPNPDTPPPVPPPPPITPPPVPPAAPSLTLQKLYSDLVSAMQHDPDVTDAQGNINATFSQFNWYLTSVAPSLAAGGMLPDYYTATAGQTDPNTPINIGPYWGIMQPWLITNKGLSGISERQDRQHAPILWRPYVGPGGWRA